MEKAIVDKFNFINYISGYNLVKDLRSKILMISNDYAQIAGWRSSQEAAGKTDYDIPCKAAEFAPEFIKLDKNVIFSQSQSLSIEIQKFLLDWKIMLVERIPLFNDDKQIVGLYVRGIDVSNVGSFKKYLVLNRLDANQYGHNFISAAYLLTEHQKTFHLTEKQENCLFLLMRGKTLKEIGKTLGISYRTVECHIDAIKNKLGCQRKSEIVEKAIDSDFLSYIPKGIPKNDIISKL